MLYGSTAPRGEASNNVGTTPTPPPPETRPAKTSSQQLAARAGTHRELSVPGDSLLNFQAETFEVRHKLVVRLETAGTSTSAPEVSMPLLVHPVNTTPASEVKLEGMAAAAAAIAPLPGSAEKAFATLMMETDADGKVEPVAVVPESAVTSAYKNEPPGV